MYDWNKVSKRGVGFPSTMPRSLAKEMREQEEKAKEEAKKASIKRKAPDPPSRASTLPTSRFGSDTVSMADELSSGPYYYASLARTTSSESTTLPKGCYCQLGSGFRALIFLCIILGVTAGLVYWIYMVHFLKEDGTFPEETPPRVKSSSNESYFSIKNGNNNINRLSLPNLQRHRVAPSKNTNLESFNETFNKTIAKIMKTLSTTKVNSIRSEDKNLETHFLKAKDLRVYTDFDGKLHNLSELTSKPLLEKKIKMPRLYTPEDNDRNHTSPSIKSNITEIKFSVSNQPKLTYSASSFKTEPSGNSSDNPMDLSRDELKGLSDSIDFSPSTSPLHLHNIFDDMTNTKTIEARAANNETNRSSYKADSMANNTFEVVSEEMETSTQNILSYENQDTVEFDSNWEITTDGVLFSNELVELTTISENTTLQDVVTTNPNIRVITGKFEAF